ncbi:MAG: beta-propeller domain-containing protein, partial [Clostridia bacterium]|nr:beta-propeller domain-containing protein [Clostridia bacterium]
MLRDEYKKQMDNIRADESVKEKVLNAIKEKPKKTKRSKVVYFRAAAAVAASIAVALSVIIVKDSVPQKVEEVGTVKTYSEVYKTLEALVPKTNAIDQLIDTIGDFVTYGAKGTDDIELEYEYVAEESTNGTTAPTVTSDDLNNKTDYSETTTQVKGVDEADIVKTDGKYIYSFNGSEIKIIKAGKTPQLIKKITVASNDFSPTSSMYLTGGKLIIIGNITNNQSEGTVVNIYDVSDPQNAKVVYELKQSGFYNTSRLIGDKLYLISNYTINANKIDEDDIESFVPCVDSKTYNGAMAAEDIFINRNCSRAVYTVICGYGINDGSLLGSQSVLGGTYTLYCSTGNIITADYQKDNKTNITRFAIDNGKVEFKAEGTIDGSLLNQFSIDEYKGYFRFVTTKNTGKETRYDDVVEYTLEQTNALTVLDGELKTVGTIDGIAPNERVYSVRFMGDTAYFVTFRQV